MTCRGCRSDRLDPVFEMDPMPLAGGFAETAEAARAMPKYPLTWLLCHDCGLVNVDPDIPDELIYANYSYAASTVPALVRHHAEFAGLLRDRYREPIRLAEIGGNDGVLLNQLPDSWERWNVDPSDVAFRAAHGARWWWTPSAATLQGPFDVITSSNALAHFTGIADTLDWVASALKPGGEFWVEVHDLQATLSSEQWDTIYHEHKVEWSRWALQWNLHLRGLVCEGVWALPLHGGLIRAVFRKRIGAPVIWGPEPLDFKWLRWRYDQREPLGATAAYGAAARATVYLNQVHEPVEYVVDGSPLRAGKFVPGLGVPVVPPEQFGNPDRTIITAHTQADDIKAKHPGYDGWVTAW